MSSRPDSYVEALTPSVDVFGDGASEGAVRVNEVWRVKTVLFLFPPYPSPPFPASLLPPHSSLSSLILVPFFSLPPFFLYLPFLSPSLPHHYSIHAKESQARKRGLTWKWTGWNLDLGLPGSRILRKRMLFKPPGQWYLVSAAWENWYTLQQTVSWEHFLLGYTREVSFCRKV